MTKREDIYDTQINPLMAQIIAICGAHDIPFVASFQINDERPDGEGLLCTSANAPSDTCENIKGALRAIRNRPQMFAFTVSSSGATGSQP